MKNFLFIVGVLFVLFGTFVKFGEKNFPVNGEPVELIATGVVASTNPYDIPKNREYLGVVSAESYNVFDVISQSDLAYEHRMLELNDHVLLYSWNGNIYPATARIDWVQFGERVKREAEGVFRFCFIFGLLLICCCRAKAKMDMIKG